MKLLITAFAMAAALAGATITIPKNAVESAPGTYHYTDAQGKKWIYRQTPFGVARLPEDADRPAPPVALPDPSAGIKATAEGDIIHFERPGPFGVYKWQKNKSELDDVERAAWSRAMAASTKTAAPVK